MMLSLGPLTPFITYRDTVLDIVQQNSPEQYFHSLILFAILFILLYLFKNYILHALRKVTKRTKTDIDDYIIEFIQQIHWPFYLFLALWVTIKTIEVPFWLLQVINVLLTVSLVFYFAKGLNKVADYFSKKQIDKLPEEDKEHESHHITLLSGIFKVFIWITAGLLLLSNFGVNITSLIAGLGVGGIAIAFALQNVLTDLFSAFTIYFDKPFKVGDFINIGTDKGTIKQIGLKSTRLQTLQGEELIISNRELTSARINNFKKVTRRKIGFKFGVEYATSLVKLKKINDIVRDIFSKIDAAELDRVHFYQFGESSLDFEVVYYFNSRAYNDYLDTQQLINWEIKKALEKEKIEFAFPTQTIHLKK